MQMTLIRNLTAFALGMSAFGALAQSVVGVSWSNFQEERWKTDEAAIRGQLEKLGAKYISADAGGSPEKQLADIKIVGDEYTDRWKPEVAQKNMEQIITKAGGKVDAVVAANDGTAGGVVAALTAKGIRGIPVSGQDADHAALNRIALGTQTVSVWKDSRELGKEAANAAVALTAGKPVEKAK